MILFLVEFTTMAGRRLRDAVKMVLTSKGHGKFDSNVHIVIAGLTNTYSQYVTTIEEYRVQRYEVCITHFSISLLTTTSHWPPSLQIFLSVQLCSSFSH